MKTERVRLDSLHPNPDNPRKHSDIQLRELAKSLELFGQIRPVVVDEANMILAGHGLWLAARQSGAETIDVLRKTGLSPRQKTKLLLADNKLAELGADDYDKVLDLLRGFGDDLEIPGFDPSALEALVTSVNAALDDYGNDARHDEQPRAANSFMDEGPAPSRGAHHESEAAPAEESRGRMVRCPECGMEFEL